MHQSQRQEVCDILAYCMLEEWLQFMHAIAQAIKGQDITDLNVACMLVESLLCGNTLQIFQNKRQFTRRGTTQHLLNASWQQPSIYPL
eukprot:14379035-Ditylum_brightwellii.AAC.1